MTRKLKTSATMAAALVGTIEHGGTLVRWAGGYWTHPGATVARESFNSGRVPAWYVSTVTVEALIARGRFRVTKRMTRGQACEVELVPFEEPAQ